MIKTYIKRRSLFLIESVFYYWSLIFELSNFRSAQLLLRTMTVGVVFFGTGCLKVA